MDPTSPTATPGHRKIPSHAKRVFHGVLFDVYQWDQEMFDGSHQTFEALRRIPSTEVILVDGEQIIIAEQEQPGRPPYLSLFGGQMRDDEPTDPLEHAKKELLEETGFEAEEWTYLEDTNFPMHKLDWHNYIFVARSPRKVQEPQLDVGEKIKLRHVSFDEFLRLAASEIHWGPLPDLFNKVPNPEGAARLRDIVMKGAQ